MGRETVPPPPPLAPLPANIPAQTPESSAEEIPTEEIPVSSGMSEPPKESRNKREKLQEYETLFFGESDLPPARFGKSVYIRKEYHERITQIISSGEISLFGYIDNVLTRHFENFRDEMIQYVKKNNFFVK